MTKFSIIIPVRNRLGELCRALKSVDSQTFQDFECVVVDDESRLPIGPVVFQNYGPWFTGIRLDDRSERVVAWTKGIEATSGEWLCRLDSDDEFASHYLEAVNGAILQHPEARCFNFGAVIHHRKRSDNGPVYTRTSIRPTFRPKWLGDKHVEFKSGKIGTGHFVFHRSVLDEIEWLPQVRSPYKFHEMATDVHHLYPFPGTTLGNPWGDDYLAFYRITRKFQSIPIEPALYIQHTRTG